MVIIYVVHNGALMALKQGTDLMYINTNLEPPQKHAAGRRAGVELCQSTVLRNACVPSPPPAL